MRNITDIFEAVASQTALGAKIKEICGEKGVYDARLKAWVYEPVNPIYVIRENTEGEVAPVVYGLSLSNRGKCTIMFGDEYDFENRKFLTYKEIQSQPLKLRDYEIQIDKKTLKEIVEAILNHKAGKNTYYSDSIDKAKNPPIKVIPFDPTGTASRTKNPYSQTDTPAPAKPVKTEKPETTTMTPPEIFALKAHKKTKLKLIEQLPMSELLSGNHIEWMKEWFRKNVPTDNYLPQKGIFLDKDKTSNNWNACVTEVFYDIKTKRMCIDLYVQGDSTDWTEYYDLWDFIRNNKAKLQRGGTIKFSKDEVASVVREIYKAMVNLK
jgi:hypothetical protein